MRMREERRMKMEERKIEKLCAGEVKRGNDVIPAGFGILNFDLKIFDIEKGMEGRYGGGTGN